MGLLPENFVIENEGGACPFQAEGAYGDERFYFRYRHDCASLSVGPPSDGEGSMPVHPPRLYAEVFSVFGDPWRGWLESDEAHRLMAEMVTALKPPNEWEFGTHRDRLMAQVTALVAEMEKEKEDDECL